MTRFEWDPEKARINARKHGIEFDDAKLVWSDPLHRVRPDRHATGEARWEAIGLVRGVVVLIVVHTARGSTGAIIRIISARRATRNERRQYDYGEF